MCFLAYKETLLAELRFFGAWTLATHVLLHVLIAPIELFFASFVGFSDPRGPLYVVAALAFTLLGAELLRRRLAPDLPPADEPAAA